MHICTYAGDLQISKRNFFFRSKWFSLPASATCATSLLAPSSQTSLSLSVSLLLLITSLARRYQGLILIMMVLVMMITMLTKHLQHEQRALVHLSQPVPNLLWHRNLCLWGGKLICLFACFFMFFVCLFLSFVCLYVCLIDINTPIFDAQNLHEIFAIKFTLEVSTKCSI